MKDQSVWQITNAFQHRIMHDQVSPKSDHSYGLP